MLTAAPSVVSTVPSRHANAVGASTSLTVTFNEAMNGGTFTANATVFVTGSQSGRHSGTISYNAGTNTMTFDPVANFMTGEAVTVTLTTGITNIGGTPLVTGYSWMFIIASGAGNSLESPVWIVADAYDPFSLAVSDLDGDGDADIAAANYRDGVVTAVENNGDETFEFPVLLTGTGKLPYDIRAADLDGDGDLDLVSAEYQNHGVTVWRNNGNFSFESIAFYQTGHHPIAVISTDLDGDGDNDIATANYSAGTVSVLKNNGNGTFGASVDSSAGVAPRALTAADIDSDGDVDLILATEGDQELTSPIPGSGAVTVLKNNGSGTFSNFSGTNYFYEYRSGEYPRSVIAADLDSDGDIDVATANFGGNNVSVLINNGGGFNDTEFYLVDTKPVDMCAADMDGDGDLDLTTVNYANATVSLLKNNGNGTFGAKTEYSSGPNATSVTAADTDGDGLMDLVLGSNGTFNSFYIVKGSTAVLPVEMASFNGSPQWRNAVLRWNTATEVKNYGFEIERKTRVNELSKKMQWSTLGFVPGNGTSNTPREYSYMDKNLSMGTYIYRLKQIDNDGKFSYSREIELSVSTSPELFILEQNYPNPFNPSTTIGYQIPQNGMTTLAVYDEAGRQVAVLVNEVKEAGYYTVVFDGKNIASGAYFARLQFDGKMKTKKLVLMK